MTRETYNMSDIFWFGVTNLEEEPIPTSGYMDYVYRLLSPGESYENGITAKNPSSTTSVFRHVLEGSSGLTSKYISTCLSLQALKCFASKSRSPGNMIKTDIDKLRLLRNDVEIIDLTNYYEMVYHISHGADEDETSKFKNFINKFEEVLLTGPIPASCIELVKMEC